MAIQYLSGINVSGSVGIGTDSPQKPLDVNGEVLFRDHLFIGGHGENNSTNSIEIGRNRTGNGICFFDMTTDNTTYTDYGFRLIRWSGVNAETELYHRGTGNFNIKGQEASNVTFSTSNSERMRITSNGNVGIGTTNPTEKLDVNGTFRATGAGAIQGRFSVGTSSSSDIDMLRAGGNYITATNAAGVLYFRTVNDIRMSILANGNVGIGTTSPSQKLQVGGNIYTTGSIRIETTGNQLEFGNANVALQRTSNLLELGGYDGIVFKSSNAALDSQAERMRITSSGNVGIGTTNPLEKLHVEGNLELQSNFTISSNSGNYWQRIRTVDATASTTNAFLFETRNGTGNYLSHMVIRNDGNVGIGTTSPSYKLAVVGKSYLSGGIQLNSGDEIDFGNSQQYITGVNDTSLTLATGGSATLTALANGNVGIGTTSPSAKLDVVGNVNTDNSISIQGLDTGNPSASSEELRLSGYGVLGNRSAMYITNGHATGTMRFGVGGSVGNHGSNVRMVLNSAGNLGIGTTSPSSKLQVSHAGTNNGLLLENTSQASGFQILQNIRQTEGLIWQKQTSGSFTSNLMTLGYDGDLGIGTTSPGSLLHVEGSRTTAVFQANQTGAGVIANFKQGGSSKVLIDNSGNVGIGTTSPGAKLHVNGDAQATQFSVGSSGTMQLFDYSGNLHIYSTAGTDILLGGGIGGRQNDVVIGNGDLRVSGSVKMGNDSDAASAGKAGTLRYRVSGNNSYVDMCMRTGATTYAWVNIVQNNW